MYWNPGIPLALLNGHSQRITVAGLAVPNLPIPMIQTELLFTPDAHLQALTQLLQDCVMGGASLGFLSPLGADEAQAYWDGVAADMRSGARLLLVAMEGVELAGAVQLALCGKKNGQHRAEIEKLMVHTRHRRKGLGDALMLGIEALAGEHGRSLLVLDTRCDDTASTLYRKHGYIEAGRIPGYALSADGGLDGTSYFYKQM